MLLDASVLVDLFVASARSLRVRRYFGSQMNLPVVSDFAMGEFAGAVKRYVLMGELSRSEALDIFQELDAWSAEHADIVPTEPVDIRLAATFVRRLDVKLRMPDAMYLALAYRLTTPLCSFDADQMAAAQQFGIAVAEIP